MFSRRLGVIAFAALVLAACGGRTSSKPGPDAGGAGGSTPGSGAGGSTAGVAGAGTGPDQGGPYFFCKNEPDGYKKYCPQSGGDWGFAIWHVGSSGQGTPCSGGADCNACNCDVGCTGKQPGECPAGSSGTAQPECLGPPSSIGTCYLMCDHGETCPDGMRCVQAPGVQGRVCAWVG